MPVSRDAGSLRVLQAEVETFIRTHQHPTLVEDEAEIFDLAAVSWRLTVEFNRLLLEVWSSVRSFARRVEDVAYRDRGRLGLFVRKAGGRGTTTLEIRERRAAEQLPRGTARMTYRSSLLSLLAREYPGWKMDRVSTRSDREHSFSGRYTRGLARRGTAAWAFLGLPPGEAPAAGDAMLAHGLIWLDWLRNQADRFTVTGLKLFLPQESLEPVAHRAAYLDARALQLEVFPWEPSGARPAALDLRDYGNVSTRLAPRQQAEALRERHLPIVRQLAGDRWRQIETAPDAETHSLSLRVHGLEVARIEGWLAPQISWIVGGNRQRLTPENEAVFRAFLDQVLEVRRAASRDHHHELCRLQGERWLESLLAGDIGRVDPSLQPEFVYPQVPAFTGQDRGVIDILAATRQGRLAVIELKLDEDINLPLQGLDYWLRVRWLHERGQFQEFNYFPGMTLSRLPPLLYLVSPAFRFHSSTDRIIRYLHPSLEVIKVGLNQQWRNGVRVLFRRNCRETA